MLLDSEDESVMTVNKPCAIQYGTRKKKLDPKIIVDSDLEGGALEALGDIQYVNITMIIPRHSYSLFSDRTLFQFEQFLYTCRGPSSEENACYKLWKAVTQFQKTVPRKHDSLAIHIHKTFISLNSKYNLPDDLFDFLDQDPEQFSDVEKLRPKSTALMKLKKLAEEYLGPAIKDFLQKEGKLPDDTVRQKVIKKVFLTNCQVFA